MDDEPYKAEVLRLHGEIATLGPEILEPGPHYYMFPNKALVSPDGHSTILPFVMEGSFNDATKNIEKVLELVQEADGHPDFDVLIAGDASVSVEFNEIAEQDLVRGETFAIPVALVILVLLFGALVASVLPIVLAMVSITVALGATALVGQTPLEVSFFVTNMITMMGLAVGIDYSLFIVSRYREERAKGLGNIEAIGATGATAGRAVFFSGVTVVLALVGMVIVPATVFQSLGLGAILVVIAAVLASMTLLPAVLSLLGDKVNAWRVPLIGRGVGAAQAESDDLAASGTGSPVQ